MKNTRCGHGMDQGMVYTFHRQACDSSACVTHTSKLLVKNVQASPVVDDTFFPLMLSESEQDLAFLGLLFPSFLTIETE